MTIKQQIETNLKTAMLAGDKTLVTTLRGLKSVILYAEVASGSRDTGLDDDQIIKLFQKEAKKRQESADLYGQGGNAEKQNAELAEKAIIKQYLPAELTTEQVSELVDQAVSEIGNDPQKMGQIIGFVKQKAGGSADGAAIAELVKAKFK